jgi:uncharacterized protein
MENKKHTNRLIHASSPYLLQHAHNPVDWYEWGDEAFEKARREDKLVLISIGYSACHWCHVMEREAFEKEDTAALMNAHFVCIKVDREERPDVDQVYMDAVQLITGRGGWPLNCFALPDGRPVHGGTYFPKQEWERVLKSLADFYRLNKEEALKYATDLTNGIRKLSVIDPQHPGQMLSAGQIGKLVEARKSDFDPDLGGFSWAPKFPMPVSWELFLQQHYYTKDQTLLDAVNTTLVKMAEGGIYDQVAGGFARYSTDVFWKVPHFEKMLYDNAQLVSLYSNAYRVTQNRLFRKTVKQTLSFIANELTAAEGIFYSALDADSEGVEGKFYTWHKKELQHLLGEDESLFSLYYSIDAYGNWEDEVNILYKTRTDAELEQLTGRPVSEIEAVIDNCCRKLLMQRENRIRPGLDDKMITSWNALMIKGYADAYLAFGEMPYLHAAKKAADFIMNTMWDNKVLMRIYKNGKVSIPGFAEDYALLCEGMVRLYEATAEEQYLLFARDVVDSCIVQFYDEASGVFYFKSKNDAPLVAAKSDLNDDVIPSSNAVLAKCLVLLSYFFENDDYLHMADRMLWGMSSKIQQHPGGYSYWMQVMLLRHYGLYQLVCAGQGAESHAVQLAEKYIPNGVQAYAVTGTVIPLLKEKEPGNLLQFYVCHDKTCGLPVRSVAAVYEQLK